MNKLDETDTNFSENIIPLDTCQTWIQQEKQHALLQQMKIQKSAPIILSKIVELFILELTKRSAYSRNNIFDRSPLKVS
jgi:hypothetical protein